MKNTEIFEMLLFGIVLPYMVLKMQQPDPKDVEKRKAVTAACTQELQAALGREPEQSEISRASAQLPARFDGDGDFLGAQVDHGGRVLHHRISPCTDRSSLLSIFAAVVQRVAVYLSRNCSSWSASWSAGTGYNARYQCLPESTSSPSCSAASSSARAFITG